MKRLAFFLLLFLLVAQALSQGSRAFQDTYVHVKIRADSIGVPAGTPEAGVVWLFSRGSLGWWTKDHAGNVAALAGVSNLDALTDVAITSPTTGDVPVYNSSSGQWENQATPDMQASGGKSLALNGSGGAIVNAIQTQAIAGFDSSMTVLARVLPLFSGQGRHLDTAFVHTSGSATNFRFNIYTGTTLGTPTDSLFTSPWTVTTVNGRAQKLASDCRNSANLGYGFWWIRLTAITSKPDAWTLQFITD